MSKKRMGNPEKKFMLNTEQNTEQTFPFVFCLYFSVQPTTYKRVGSRQ